MANSKDQSISEKIYDCLMAHGPLTSYELAERLGIRPITASSTCGHLVRLDKIQPLAGASFRPIGAKGRRCHRWQINPHPDQERGYVKADTQRRANWNHGLTPEDEAWMRHYRQRYEQRLAQRRGSDVTHADGNG